MNKSQLVDAVQSSLGGDTSKAGAEAAVSAVLDGITQGVSGDGSVQLIGFGTFSVVNRAARMGVNPRTGEKIQIKASKAVQFKAGAGLQSAAS